MVITSKSNPIVKEISKLNDKKYRKEKGLYLVEGIKLVNECIASECFVENIICTENLAENYPKSIIVSDDIFKNLSSEITPQGVLAVIRKPQNILKNPQCSCILLDCLQDPGNLGTIIRTANAAGYKEIYLINCTDPYSPKAVRASMGGIFYVKIYQGTKAEILNMLSGIELICADMSGQDIFQFTAPEKFCLCIGNEGNGISRDIINFSDYKIKIPMDTSCESLNAAVSAGIAMYQLKYNKR